MTRGVWVAVALLLVSGLAGCLDQGQGEGPTAQAGDFVRIHYVARYQDNGTVLESTYNGTWPQGGSLEEIPFEEHLPAQLWVFMWHETVLENQTGRGLLTDVDFKDLNSDDFRESMFLTRADLIRQNGSRVRRNQSEAFYDVPLQVIGDPNVMNQGVYEGLRGKQAGDTIEDLVVPPRKAFGEHDPSQVREFPRLAANNSRNLTDQPIERVRQRGNFSDATEEGDVIAYRLFNETEATARVLNVTDSTVDLYLHLENGTQTRLPDLWNATIVNVTRWSYDLHYTPQVGERYAIQRRGGTFNFRVVELNATTMTLDFNPPEAGESFVYDIKVLDVVRPDLDQLFRGRPVDPFKAGENVVHDVAMISPTTALVATDKGLFTTFDFAQSWYPFTVDQLGRRTTLVEAGRAHGGEIWVVSNGTLSRTDNTGFNWTARSPDGTVTALGQAPSDPTTVYVLVEDRGLFRSDDRGRSWEQVSDALAGAKALATGWDDPETLWAATGTGLRQSTDGGETWEVHSFEGQDVRDVHVVDDHTLYAVVDGNFNVTFETGQNWTLQGARGRDLTRIGFSHENPDRLVATNATSGIFISLNGGAVWPTIRRGSTG